MATGCVYSRRLDSRVVCVVQDRQSSTHCSGLELELSASFPEQSPSNQHLTTWWTSSWWLQWAAATAQPWSQSHQSQHLRRTDIDCRLQYVMLSFYATTTTWVIPVPFLFDLKKNVYGQKFCSKCLLKWVCHSLELFLVLDTYIALDTGYLLI